MKRFTWASYGMYFLGGMISVIFGAVMPEFLQHYHASYTTGGLVILLQAVGFMIGVPMAFLTMNRYHYRFVLAGSALAIAVSQVVIFRLPALAVVEIFSVLNGVGASALETAVASYIMETFSKQRAIVMSRLEVCFGLGALVTPAAASVFISLGGWSLSFLFLATVSTILVVVWLSTTVSLDANQASMMTQLDAHSADAPVFRRHIARYGIFSLFLFVILVYVGLEGSVNSFMPAVFTETLHAHAALASLSVTSFWIAMVIGRLGIGWVVRRVHYERYLLWSVTASFFCFGLLALLHQMWASFGLAFCVGLTMSAIYSITMVYATHTFPLIVRRVTSLVTLFAGMGSAAFPALTGYSMDHLQPVAIPWLFVTFSLILVLSMGGIVVTLAVMKSRAVSSFNTE